ncbi:RNA-guided endonuclease InsQ/TnpB family protein [Clostridium sp.]|uniref:RNA-guided endonuclease InsQ/TnpB family protein n=1 Tax=Clostridium sp. TaxID=1506 RepID=UPI003F3AF38B
MINENNWIKKNKGYKFRLKPNKEQQIYFSKAFGCSRKLYNIYTDLLYSKLEAEGYENGIISYAKLNLPTPATIKKDYEYMKEVDSLAFANVQLDFKDAIKKFNKEYDRKSYKKSAKKKVETIGRELTFRDLKGLPSFKSKKKNQDSYTTNNQNGTVSIVNEKYIKLPKIKSLVKFVNHRQIPNNCTIKSATISNDCRGKYYISFTVEYYVKDNTITNPNIDKVVGLDYAQQNFYVSSDGEKANYPKYYKKSEKRLKIEQRKLSRKKMFSSNWHKQKAKLSKLYTKVANQRKDWIHKKSRELANNYDVVIVENLDLRNLAQCLSLGKNLHDNSFGMFRTFLKYKLEEKGGHLIKINKWYPSSKLCSNCGNKQELELSDRIYNCNNCGLEIDRDYNSALNLKTVGTTELAWLPIPLVENTVS